MYTSDLMKTLENKIALVTGSSRGMGKDIALRLSDHVAGVVIHYRRDRDAAMSVVEEIRAKGKSSVSIRADLTKEKEAQQLIQRSREKIADIDILVNNFGPILVKPWEDLEPEDWDHMLHSNLESAFYCIKAVLAGMRKKIWGRIINIGYSRVEQLVAYQRILPYAIAKTGLLILTRSVAASVAADGITVNMVSPGLMEGGVLPKDQNIPAGRLGRFEDVSNAVLFLVSKQASYMTGTNLIVSGGWKI
jgi:3-oxoacyl-[acyl-carrier protein] reductase